MHFATLSPSHLPLDHLFIRPLAFFYLPLANVFFHFALDPPLSIINPMNNLIKRFGAIPFILLGAGLMIIGLLAMNHIVDNFWPIDVSRLDLVRATAQDRVEATSLLQAANQEIIIAFLAGVAVSVTGLVLPLVYYLNKRFGSGDPSHYLFIMRQSMWVGAWFAFCTWLQMNRSLGWGVALLVAAVLAIFEFMLQIRERAAATE